MRPSIFNRTLTINGVDRPLPLGAEHHLLKADLVYQCGDDHDLHLSPDGPNDKGWTLEAVENLTAILLGSALPNLPQKAKP